MELSAVQARVLGALMEKQVLTPDVYPMTLNGLVTACNQTSSRDPVMRLEPAEVEQAVLDMKVLKLTRVVHPAAGERATKYRHIVDETLRLEPAEHAVLTLLLLRGPQTVAELRTRSERLHAFESAVEVEEALDALASRDESLVVLLERLPGHKEARWAHLMAGPIDAQTLAASAHPPSSPSRIESLEQRVADLEAEQALLAKELARLRAALADLLPE
ncbi:MAG TPA: YceH family protein [Acidimicrobiales bacterium]